MVLCVQTAKTIYLTSGKSLMPLHLKALNSILDMLCGQGCDSTFTYQNNRLTSAHFTVMIFS